jgi:hypothetical protein
MKRTPMAETIKAGTVLIKEGALLPEALQFESEFCVPGWRLVKGLDGHALDREQRSRVDLLLPR